MFAVLTVGRRRSRLGRGTESPSAVRCALTALALWLTLSAAAVGAAGVAGLEWSPPAGWAAEAARPMRAATYAVPAVGGSEAGECAIFYFGPGQGGSVEANVARWLGQFEPAGGSSELAVERGSMAINGIPVTTLDVSGTFLFKPFPAAPQATRKPGYRMLAAIAEGPEGPVFFKLTAPAATAQAAEAAFEEMLASLRPIG